MMTVRGRSLPTSISGYRAEFDGVKGFVVTIEGRSAFLSHDAAEEFGAFLQTREPRPDTSGMTLHDLVQPAP
jgi:hypothetical protein